LDLTVCLAGEQAKKNRAAIASIIHRYFAGDKSLLDEIEANAQSDHPVARMARESLPVDDKEIQEDRKRRRELEEVELQMKKTDMEQKRISNISAFASLMTILNPTWTQDERLVLQTQDLLKNTMFHSTTAQASITNGELEPITVSQVAQDMGKRPTNSQLIKIGRMLAKRYRDKYGEEPSKHTQYVDGAARKVNSYTGRDRDLVMEAIEEFME
jgi:hypothetical protein